jgi:hypothetical protein
MEGKDVQKTFFGGGAMGNDPATLEGCFDARPEIDKEGCVFKLLIRDAMDLLSGPCDWSRGAKMRV